MRVLYAGLVILFCAISSAFCQGEIAAILPNFGYPGEQLRLLVRGQNTSFVQGRTSVELGEGISIGGIEVIDESSLSLSIRISTEATSGFRTLAITTPSGMVLAAGLFEILLPSSALTARLEALPVDAIYLSDFDPAHIENAPLLFLIHLVNDNIQREVRLVLTIFSERYGKVVLCEKLLNLAPGQSAAVTNRQFDSYDLTDVGQGLIDITTETGILPADTYRYTLQVTSMQGRVLAEDEAVQITTNSGTELQLIGPGAPFNEELMVISSEFPLFQWFSQASLFDFQLYEVNEEQLAAEDVVTNIPWHQQSGLTSQQLVYPVHAQLLISGRTYAWQITAHLSTSHGEELLASPVYRFRYFNPSAEQIVESITVLPEYCELYVGENCSFTGRALSAQGGVVESVRFWRVVPAEAGTIDANGLFKAGQRPVSCAVICEAEGQSAYASVLIKWRYNLWDMRVFMRQLLGIPDSTAAR